MRVSITVRINCVPKGTYVIATTSAIIRGTFTKN